MAHQSLREVFQFVDQGLTIYIGHSRHGLFFTRWIVNPMLNFLKRTMIYPGFEPGTFGVAVSIPNHLTI
jgi:hypothetical protein